MKKSMKRILKKIVKVILYTLLILVLAFVSIFAWFKVGDMWRERNFEPKPQLTVIGKPFVDFEAELPDSTVHHFSEYAGKGLYVLLAPDGQVIFSPNEKHGFVDDERQQLQAKLAKIFEE